MGNHRFRLSDMIPNAWFYKLKDMSRSRKQYTSQTIKRKPTSTTAKSLQKHNISQPRNSYYFTTDPDKFYVNSPTYLEDSDTRVPDPLTKLSKKRRSKRKTIYKPSPKFVSPSFSADCNCQAMVNSPDYSSSAFDSSPELDFHESFLFESEEDNDFVVSDQSFDCQVASWSATSCNCNDIIIDMNDESFERKTKKLDGFDMDSEVELSPILTKPTNFTEDTMSKGIPSKLEEIKARRPLPFKTVKEDNIKTRKEEKTKKSFSPTGIRIRPNSPRIARKKVQACARKSMSRNKSSTLSESFAVVKSSVDPQRDFRDSMVEMIVENNIRASKDLEELLACYLSLNSKEYHDLIVKAFEQIWFEMTDLHL